MACQPIGVIRRHSQNGCRAEGSGLAIAHSVLDPLFLLADLASEFDDDRQEGYAQLLPQEIMGNQPVELGVVESKRCDRILAFRHAFLRGKCVACGVPPFDEAFHGTMPLLAVRSFALA